MLKAGFYPVSCIVYLIHVPKSITTMNKDIVTALINKGGSVPETTVEAKTAEKIQKKVLKAVKSPFSCVYHQRF